MANDSAGTGSNFAARFDIVPYARRYRRATMRLVTEAYLVHTHLDWQSVDDWLDDPTMLMLMAWRDNVLHGVIATSEVLGGATWLRLVAVADLAEPAGVLAALWSALRSLLIVNSVREVGVLLIRNWLLDHLPALGFNYGEDIVTLRRYGTDILPPLHDDVRIRPAYWNDLPAVVAIDHAAFGPLWQMGSRSLRYASRMAASFSLAELQGQLVGYQLSTQHSDGGHLARLAVLPEVQGHGIGGSLLGAMLRHFVRRGIESVSVNTQEHNVQSQRLYERYGFERTMQDLPFWKIEL
ncbi:MAG: GNAT family N-acetyltransferase [Anaerolineae bacterium]|nr:GNAT family N-acetyltransferase [Anaerolineae bacterium]